jgi:hypothetical protein
MGWMDRQVYRGRAAIVVVPPGILAIICGFVKAKEVHQERWMSG